MADIPAATWSQTDASNTTASPEGAPEGMAPGGVNNTIRMMMGAIKRWFAWSTPATTAGTADAFTITYTVAPTALVDGMSHVVHFNAAANASATLNVNSLGAVPLHYYTGSAWAAIGAGVITANMVCTVTYNSGAGTYRIYTLPSIVGAAMLAANNAFTGNNSFAGTSDFNGAVTLDAATTITGDLTATAGTNSIKAAMHTDSTATTQSAGNNSTKLATTAYADAAAAAVAIDHAFAYCTISAGTLTVERDVNVSTVVRDSDGHYTVTMSSAMANTDYAVIATAKNADTVGSVVMFEDSAGSRSTTEFKLQAATVGGSVTDPLAFSVVVFEIA